MSSTELCDMCRANKVCWYHQTLEGVEEDLLLVKDAATEKHAAFKNINDAKIGEKKWKKNSKGKRTATRPVVGTWTRRASTVAAVVAGMYAPGVDALNFMIGWRRMQERKARTALQAAMKRVSATKYNHLFERMHQKSLDDILRTHKDEDLKQMFANMSPENCGETLLQLMKKHPTRSTASSVP